jgi:hypothetical protein
MAMLLTSVSLGPFDDDDNDKGDVGEIHTRSREQYFRLQECLSILPVSAVIEFNLVQDIQFRSTADVSRSRGVKVGFRK